MASAVPPWSLSFLAPKPEPGIAVPNHFANPEMQLDFKITGCPEAVVAFCKSADANARVLSHAFEDAGDFTIIFFVTSCSATVYTITVFDSAGKVTNTVAIDFSRDDEGFEWDSVIFCTKRRSVDPLIFAISRYPKGCRFVASTSTSFIDETGAVLRDITIDKNGPGLSISPHRDGFLMIPYELGLGIVTRFVAVTSVTLTTGNIEFPDCHVPLCDGYGARRLLFGDSLVDVADLDFEQYPRQEGEFVRAIAQSGSYYLVDVQRKIFVRTRGWKPGMPEFFVTAEPVPPYLVESLFSNDNGFVFNLGGSGMSARFLTVKFSGRLPCLTAQYH